MSKYPVGTDTSGLFNEVHCRVEVSQLGNLGEMAIEFTGMDVLVRCMQYIYPVSAMSIYIRRYARMFTTSIDQHQSYSSMPKLDSISSALF